MTKKSPSQGRIFIVDDDPSVRELLQDFLTLQGYAVVSESSSKEALRRIREASVDAPYDLVVSDIRMSGLDGMELLQEIHADFPDLPFILITGYASVDTAVNAMRKGAFHYFVKPFKLNEVAVIVEKAMDARRLTLTNRELKREIRGRWSLSNILGKSAAMKRVFDLVERVAPSMANVLIQGESGTGKELVARAIHTLGPRSKFPFVAINCTAIPESLLESELFGYAKGAFTGAMGAKKGLIEEANHGTLFLDEIGDMSPPLQAKLLRVLQDRTIRPVGANQSIEVDVRVIAATHQDLKRGILEGKFREDLFYRLSVIPIELPPLRDRLEDIPVLAEHFLQKFLALHSQDSVSSHRVVGLSKDALAKLMRNSWKGNVRELENAIERAVVLCRGRQIEASDIPDPDILRPNEIFRNLTRDLPTLSELEQRYIQQVMDHTGGKKEKAAKILGINRRTLYRKGPLGPRGETGLSRLKPSFQSIGATV